MAELWLESPLEGELLALKEVNDPAFAGELMGRGAAAKNEAALSVEYRRRALKIPGCHLAAD